MSFVNLISFLAFSSSVQMAEKEKSRDKKTEVPGQAEIPPPTTSAASFPSPSEHDMGCVPEQFFPLH